MSNRSPAGMILNRDSKVRNFRQVQFPVNKNWVYQYYLKGLFENEKTGAVKEAEGFSVSVVNPNGDAKRQMMDDAIRHAQSKLGGSNWHLRRKIDSYMLISRLLKRNRKVRPVNTKGWKKATQPKRVIKKPPKKEPMNKPIQKHVKARYERIPGSSKHYRDTKTGEELTYREYRKIVNTQR